jgi:hypothetical protein
MSDKQEGTIFKLNPIWIKEDTEWKLKYAWLPKKINGKWVWREEYFFREVWAKVTKYNGEIKVSDYEWRKEYSTLLDVLRDSV